MRSPAELPVTLSILDRLIDTDPRSSTEIPLSREQSLQQLRAGVRRDLERLLNTRRIAFEPDALLAELNQSLYVIGLAEFTSFSLSDSSEQSRLLRHIQGVIRQFEPRLTNVRLSQLDDPMKSRQMRFRIEAALLVDPAPERISFDTTLQLSSGEYVVREAN
ncbi:MAG TPA: type VI secretion system baseplate subunit TssE [Bryobacteraceae bacterium]|jgi:type VI secretion system protein ImpF|nr:type VI secretion system baseplate subunit TssE [Bryobacteraceae bacterium]